MFTIKKSDSYLWPVKVRIPKDGGGYQEEGFDIEIRRMSQTKVNDYLKKISQDAITDEQFVREIAVGWKGVHDDEGNDVPFSLSNLDKILDIHGVATSIALAVSDSLAGVLRKN